MTPSQSNMSAWRGEEEEEAEAETEKRRCLDVNNFIRGFRKRCLAKELHPYPPIACVRSASTHPALTNPTTKTTKNRKIQHLREQREDYHQDPPSSHPRPEMTIVEATISTIRGNAVDPPYGLPQNAHNQNTAGQPAPNVDIPTGNNRESFRIS
ncbi:uncharacterized protein G2W53_009289 [Senna tora]|uniref:Uncharacterized protein n=1 Tax=Senna tora TaxID=362788 RepID=A0A834WXY7_9FABA|nr:uncharacterized protein G2W53_009289 [Senna tora]